MNDQSDAGDDQVNARAGHGHHMAEAQRDLMESHLNRLEDQAHLDRVARALAHPARRFALELLVAGGATASDLAASIGDTLGISPTRASHHLQVLARAGLVDVVIDGPWRWYTLARLPGEGLIVWLRELQPGLSSRAGAY